MGEEFLLDALVDYQIEPGDPTRTIPNPDRTKVDKEVKRARAELTKLEQQYFKFAIDHLEDGLPPLRMSKAVYDRLGIKMSDAKKKLDELIAKRKALPKRIEISELGEAAFVKLSTERKHITNIIKMVAYQAESDLFTMLRPHYARAEHEGRTLLHELFASCGDISVTDDTLLICLSPLSSPHRTQAVQALCEPLNNTDTKYPGTNLRIRFEVRPPPGIGLAFPGPAPERVQKTTSDIS